MSGKFTDLTTEKCSYYSSISAKYDHTTMSRATISSSMSVCQWFIASASGWSRMSTSQFRRIYPNCASSWRFACWKLCNRCSLDGCWRRPRWNLTHHLVFWFVTPIFHRYLPRLSLACLCTRWRGFLAHLSVGRSWNAPALRSEWSLRRCPSGLFIWSWRMDQAMLSISFWIHRWAPPKRYHPQQSK